MRERSTATVRVGIVGDFDRGKHSHWATEAALFHAAARLGTAVAPQWIPTSSLGSTDATQRLADLDGIWGAPGSPFASPEGMLRAIEYARRRDVAYLGTCAGFQYALIEFTRNVLGIPDADSAENDPTGENVVITPVECPMPDRPSGGPRLAGTSTVGVVSGTLVERLCGGGDLRGEYFCSFETNPKFVARWEQAGLRVAARGGDGEMRAFELPEKRFFLATLFQPQLSSSYDRPHPIIEGYLDACSRTRAAQNG
jgi:CTP synthase (UTP-ammonia lyase)